MAATMYDRQNDDSLLRFIYIKVNVEREMPRMRNAYAFVSHRIGMGSFPELFYGVGYR